MPTSRVASSPRPPLVRTVAIALGRDSVRVGDTLTAVATVRLGSTPLPGETIVWSTSDSSIASIDSVGWIRARAKGTVVIGAGNGGAESAATLLVIPKVARASIALPNSQLAVGDTMRLVASALDSSGGPITGRAVSWSVKGTWPLRASIDSAGIVRALGVGSVEIVAAIDSVRDSVSLTTIAPVVPRTSSTPRVAATIVSSGPPSDPMVVSSGFPLPPGTLTDQSAGDLRVLVEGTEVPAYVTALSCRRADGSLCSVLIQFSIPAAQTGRSVEIEIGTPSVASLDRRLVDPAGANAWLLPTDPAYLVSTGLVGPTLTSAQTSALGGTFARYESDFVKLADQHWTAMGGDWTENYYDRALIYYAFWMRTGNPEYFRRASLLAVNYRQSYLVPNNYGTSPHWSQMEGVALHYLLTGDEASRTAVGRVAEVLNLGFHRLLTDTLVSPSIENRIQARVLQSYLLAWQIDAPRTRGQQWSAWLDDGVTKVLSTQRGDGSYGFKVTCNASLNYMAGVLNDVFIKVHTSYRADARLVGAVQRSIDYLWATQWVPSASAFQYLSRNCTGIGTTASALDLNNLFATGFGWVYRQTGDATYRTRAEAIFSAGVVKTYLTGTKQFNEEYSASFRLIGYLYGLP